MKIATDFRKTAREALTGKWMIAVLVGLVAGLLGASGGEGGQIKLNLNIPSDNLHFDLAEQDVFSSATHSALSSGILPWIVGGLGILFVIAILMAVLYFVLGSIVGVGYASFNLKLVDGHETAFETLFAYFTYWKTTAAARFLSGLYIFLWSILFVVPGIVASYSYAMTDFILAEKPDLAASEAIKQSKEMMQGNRWRLFCLHFSFIGWDILAALTFGIGNLWLKPYKQAANAAFYRDISGAQVYVIE